MPHQNKHTNKHTNTQKHKQTKTKQNETQSYIYWWTAISIWTPKLIPGKHVNWRWNSFIVMEWVRCVLQTRFHIDHILTRYIICQFASDLSMLLLVAMPSHLNSNYRVKFLGGASELGLVKDPPDPPSTLSLLIFTAKYYPSPTFPSGERIGKIGAKA